MTVPNAGAMLSKYPGAMTGQVLRTGHASPLVVANTDANDETIATDPWTGNAKVPVIPVPTGYRMAGLYGIYPENTAASSGLSVVGFGRLPHPRTKGDIDWPALIDNATNEPDRIWIPLMTDATFSRGHSIGIEHQHPTLYDDGAGAPTGFRIYPFVNDLPLRGCDALQIFVLTQSGTVGSQVAVSLWT